MLQVTILGCGASLGVPVLGCACSVCKSDSIYNKRTRSAIYISDQQTKILVDFGFDIRQQLLRENITDIDAAILTHDHADHVSGLDELRALHFLHKRPLDIVTDHATSKTVEDRYKYLFTDKNKYNLPQRFNSKPVDFFSKIKIGTMDIQCFRQDHGPIDSLGIRIGDFVYSSDVVDFPEESKQLLRNVKVWVLDCLEYNSNYCHAGLDKVLRWNEELKPEQILLTNMHHTIDYHKIINELPSNIKPLYDGFKFSV